MPGVIACNEKDRKPLSAPVSAEEGAIPSLVEVSEGDVPCHTDDRAFEDDEVVAALVTADAI